ncbi:MAG: hypothetical protein MJ189_05690 [Coriobacteriales bacterium]|nr:hypothetical protein [Coriobacteriales bacterium]
MTETQILIALDAADTRIRQLTKKLNELPQIAVIKNCRAKRKELKGKQDELVDIHDNLQKKIDLLAFEEEKVIAKVNELKNVLNKSSDFRVTKSAQRDMDGQLKRQNTLASEQESLLEKQIKSDNVLNELLAMLEKLDEKENKASEEFKKLGIEIKKQIDEQILIRNECEAQLNSDLLKKYKALKEEKVNAVAVLQDGHCSMCRATFLQGQLAKLEDGPNLTECPMCRRIFIVDSTI